MHRAGDWLTVLEGPNQGRTLQIAAVRMFASDRGYYLHGDTEGWLHSPRQITLARERDGGNPCGTPCDNRHHDATGSCYCCRGVCHHHQETP